jgi:hypothetical protein
MDRMRDFFKGVGTGDATGVWERDPTLRPGFRAKRLKALERKARDAKSEEMIGCLSKIMTARAAIGARSMPSPPSKGCR